jgi:tRNA dimethylallyltransferase
VRARLRHDACEQGSEQLYARLVLVDPLTAAKLHPRDTSKILRALEVYLQSGLPLSSFQSKHGFSERPFSALVIGLNTRRFAKRQMTWFRREPELTWLMIEESEPAEQTVSRVMDMIHPFLVRMDEDVET